MAGSWQSNKGSLENDGGLSYDEKSRLNMPNTTPRAKSAGWGFLAVAFGTWGGMGPEAARTIHRLVKRAAGR